MSEPRARGELLQLARHLVDPAFCPIYLNPNNENEGRADTLAEAWRTDRAFCIRLRPEVIPIDIDQRQVPLLARFREAVEASGQPFLEVASSGPDQSNRHFFVWVPEEPARERLLEALRSISGRQPIRHGGPMRLPGVLHRNCVARSTPVNANQCKELLAAVKDHDLLDIDRLVDQLTPRTKRLLEDGPSSDRSTWDMRVTHRLLADGLSSEEIVRFGLDGSARFSEKARQREHRYPGSGERYLRLGVSKAAAGRNEGSLGIRSRDDAVELLAATAMAVAAADHRPFGGLTARRVLEACVHLFFEQSTFERPLAVRTVAEVAQVDKSTAAKWLRHLCEIGCLSQSTAARHGRAAVYWLEMSRMRTLLGSQGGCEAKSVRKPDYSVANRSPLFRHRYAGESGRLIVAALAALGGEARTKSIVERSNLSRSHAIGVLNRLETLGLTSRVRHGTWRLTDEDHDFLAELWGANFAEKRQKIRHELDKIAYGTYRLSCLERRLEVRLAHLSIQDSNTVVNGTTGETLTIDDLWADPQRAPEDAAR